MVRLWASGKAGDRLTPGLEMFISTDGPLPKIEHPAKGTMQREPATGEYISPLYTEFGSVVLLDVIACPREAIGDTDRCCETRRSAPILICVLCQMRDGGRVGTPGLPANGGSRTLLHPFTFVVDPLSTVHAVGSAMCRRVAELQLDARLTEGRMAAPGRHRM